MNASSRIAINTTAAYARSLLGMGLGLVSSRWVLSGLGATDYGLFSVVGSLIVFVTYLNGVLAGSSSRHLAFSLGEGDHDAVNRWFNASVGIHLLLSTLLILAGWPIAEYTVRHLLSIPAERLGISIAVFRLSLVSAFVNMASVPFLAMFTARQRITELSAWSAVQALFAFFLAALLSHVSSNRLVFYAAGMVIIQVAVQLAQTARAICLFPECKMQPALWFVPKRMRHLFGFASWSLIGVSGGTLRNQGTAILLNLRFGPAVNAAYGIANQISIQVATLSEAMMGAMSPEITAREGRGERTRMLALSVRACKFGALLVAPVAIPFVLEADTVLRLWLVNPPPFTAVLSQLILATFFVDMLTAGYRNAVNAYGKIAAYQSTVGVLLLLTLPLAWVLLHLGFSPTSVGVAFLVMSAASSFGRVLWVRRLFAVPVWNWVRDVVLPLLAVVGLTVLAAEVPHLLIPEGGMRLMLVTGVSLAMALTATWVVALTDEERSLMRTLGGNALQRMRLFGRQAPAPRRISGSSPIS